MNLINRKYILVILLLLVLVSCRDVLDSSVANTAFGLTALKYEFILAILSLVSGITMIIAGIVFMALGLSGKIEWIVEATDFHSRLVNASPGLVLAIMGAILVWKSRMDVKVTRKDDKDSELTNK